MYVQVEFKVIEAQAGAVARAANVNEDRVLAGLNRLWHWAWVQKNDVIDVGQLAGVFGGERIDALAAAMVAQGFLEARPDDWRIRGAERYLRIRKTRSDNAKRTNEKRWKSDDGASQVRRNSDASMAQPVALTLSTETLSTEHLKDLPATRAKVLPESKGPDRRAQAPLPLEPTAEEPEAAPDEEPERKLSAWEKAFEEFNFERGFAAKEAGFVAEVADLGDEELHPREINARLSKVSKTLSELTGLDVGAGELQPYFEVFCENPKWGEAEPPWPFDLFSSRKTLEMCVARLDEKLAEEREYRETLGREPDA